MSDEEFEKPVDTSTEKSQPKRVNFAFGTKETDATRMKHIGFHVVKKRSSEPENLLKFWVQNSQETFSTPGGSADNLRQLLNSAGLSDHAMMTSFLKKDGIGILVWPLNMLKSSQHLRFICDYAPHDLLQEALRRKNYYAVDAFLRLDSIGDNRGNFIGERKQASFEKMKILLEIDYEGLVEYSESEDFKKHRPAVQACFMQAIHEYKQEHGLDEGYKH